MVPVRERMAPAAAARKGLSGAPLQLPDEQICDCGMSRPDHGECIRPAGPICRHACPDRVAETQSTQSQKKRCRENDLLILGWVDVQQLTQTVPDPLIVHVGKLRNCIGLNHPE